MKRSHVISLAGAIILAVAVFGSVMAAGWAPKLGLDLAGGEEVVLKPAHQVNGNTLNEAINIIRNRVDGLGISGAQVGNQGQDIVVQLPGVKNPQGVINTLSETAQLYFRPVLCEAPPYQKPAAVNGKPAAPPGPLPSTCGSQYAYTASNLQPKVSANGSVTTNPLQPDPSLASQPTTSPGADNPSNPVILPVLGSGSAATARFLLGPSQLPGSAIHSASAQLTTTSGWAVQYNLTSAGSAAWDNVAQKNFHAEVAIDLDGIIESAPIIQPGQASFSSFGGSGEISGNFTETTAKNLALVLQYGSLPVSLKILTSETVSASLGHSSLTAGLLAGIGGLLLVLLYMVAYYRILGVVVLAGLVLTAALLWGIVSLIAHTNGLTLDLAGVTGIIVSIGITVDSYVVYFERLKDEARSGRSIRTGVEAGFRGAFRTVLAADLVSLLAAALLWFLAIGTVKGFAFFLGLSTLMDIFTTYFFTRPFVIALGRSRAVTDARVIGMARGLAVEAKV